jgi:hypothetical protein
MDSEIIGMLTMARGQLPKSAAQKSGPPDLAAVLDAALGRSVH